MADLFIFPFRPAYDGNMKVVPGAQLRFTLTGTNTAADVYVDEDMTTPHAAPVVANAVGRFPAIYLDEATSYRIRIYDADADYLTDTPLEEYDPYTPAVVFDVGTVMDVLVEGERITLTPTDELVEISAAGPTADEIAAIVVEGAGIDVAQVDETVVVSAAPPNIQTVASAATVTPTFLNDQVNITAQAVALDLANPTGTAVDGWGIAIRIKDNGTARAITYGAQYRAIGVTLPTTTVINKTLYLGMIYNADDTKWDVVSVGQQA